MRELFARLSRAVWMGRRLRDFDDEVEFHLDQLMADHRRRGLDAAAAREAAVRDFGGVGRAKQAWRDQWTLPAAQEVFQDIRYGGRVLRRSPGLTAVAGLMLALAIAATTSVFAVVDAVLLAPLPFGRSEQLCVLYEHFVPEHAPRVSVAPGTFMEWQDRAHAFSALTAIDMRQQNLTSDGDPQQLVLGAVSQGFAPTIEVQPAIGRLFAADEFQPGRENVVILGHALWSSRYGSAPAIVGRSITLDDRPFVVIGVMPAGFMFPDPSAQAWVPMPMTSAERESRGSHSLFAVARRRDNVSVGDAANDLHGVAAALHQQFPASNGDWNVTVVPARADMVGKTADVAVAMMGAVVLLLLVACANVAGLLVTHGLSRGREVAIRCALGASQGRIVRQLVTESLLLSLLAGFCGAGLALLARPVLAALRPEHLLTWKPVGIDARALAFAIVAALVCGVLFGALPAIIVSRSNIAAAASVRASGRGASRARQILVAVEVALAVVLVVGASLLAQTLTHLTAVDPGFAPDRLVTMRLALPAARYAETARVLAFYDSVLDRVRALQGVRAAGAIQALPLGGDSAVRPYRIDGGPSGNGRPAAAYRIVTPGYLEAMRIPLRAGRTFNSGDRSDMPLAVVVNETLARRAWGDRSPVGMRITYGGSNDRWAEVVGVVGDVRHFGPGTPAAAEMYWAAAQIDAAPGETLRRMRRGMTLVVSTVDDPLAVVPSVRAAVRSVDPTQPIALVRTMSSLLGASLWLSRAAAWLVSVFGAAALTFALLGVFAAASYAVVQRRRELALRIALGAEPVAVGRMVLLGALKSAIAGIVGGVLLAAALGRSVSWLLDGVGPTDAATLGAVAVALAAATAGACWIPARRAARLNPMEVLRVE